MSGNPHSRRHHRLFALVEVGSSVSVKRLAAQQIGELAKSNVDEIDKYLSIIWDLLRSERWETRIGAGEVLRAIANNFPPVDASLIEPQKQVKLESSAGESRLEAVRLRTFSVQPYLAAESPRLHQPTCAANTKSLGTDEYVNLQKQCAQSSLGIDPRMQRLGLADFTEGLLSAEDFDAPQAAPESSSITLMETEDAEFSDSDDEKENKKWPLAWMWRRCRKAMNERDWRHRHGAVTALREMSLAALQTFTDAVARAGFDLSAVECRPVSKYFTFTDIEQFVIEILILLATDRFCDFVADETVAPIRETAAQALAGCVNMPNCRAGVIRDRTMHILLYDMLNIDSSGHETDSTNRTKHTNDWQSRYSAMLALKYIFMVSTSTLRGTSASGTILPLSSICDIPVNSLCALFHACCVTLDDASEELAAVSAETLVHFIDSGVLLSLNSHIASKETDGLAEISNLENHTRKLMERLPELLLDSDECTVVRGAYLNLLSKLLDYESSLSQPQSAFSEDRNASADFSRFITASHAFVPVLLESVANDSSANRRSVALRAVFGIIRKICSELSCIAPDKRVDAIDVGHVLEFLFIRLLLEPNEHITRIISTEWHTVVNETLEIAPEQVYRTFIERFCYWLELAMQPVGSQLVLSEEAADGANTRQMFFAGGAAGLISDSTNESPSSAEADSTETRMARAEERALRTRQRAAYMLAYLLCKLSPMMLIRKNGSSDVLQDMLHTVLLRHLSDSHSTHIQREVACLLFAELGKCMHNWSQPPILRSSESYAEMKNDAQIDYSHCFDLARRCLFFHGLYPELLSQKVIIFSSLSYCIKELHAAAFKLLRAAVASSNVRLPAALSQLYAATIEAESATAVFSFEQVQQLCATVAQQQQHETTAAGDDELFELLTSAQEVYERAMTLTIAYNRRFRAAICYAVVSLTPHVYLPSTSAFPSFSHALPCDDADAVHQPAAFTMPLKQVLLIRPLMDALRNEIVAEHQLLAADALSSLVIDFIREQVPGQTAKKALRNVLGMCCRCMFAGCCSGGPLQMSTSERNAAVRRQPENGVGSNDEVINAWLNATFCTDDGGKTDSVHGMLSALTVQSGGGDLFDSTESLLDQLAAGGGGGSADGKSADALKRRQIGVVRVLRRVFDYYLTEAQETMPDTVKQILDGPLAEAFALNSMQPTPSEAGDIARVIDAINVVTLIVKSLSLHALLTKPSLTTVSSLFCEWFRRLARTLIGSWLCHRSIIVRHYAATLYATLVCTIMTPLLDAGDSSSDDVTVKQWQSCVISDFIVPLAAPASAANVSSDEKVEFFEYGLTEALYIFVLHAEQRVQLHLAAVLSVPMVTRINSPNVGIRALASQCFGSLVRLLPLLTSPAATSKNSCFDWLRSCDTECSRLVAEQAALFERIGSSVSKPSAEVPSLNLNAVLTPGTKLRPYQEQGVCWLTFLQKLSLGGILCDDMGLGKTLQTLCVVAGSSTAEHNRKRLPSLVICPATLILHWSNECSKFILPNVLQPVVITASNLQDNDLPSPSSAQHLLILSYDTARRFCQHSLMQNTDYNYTVLDEGHLVRNTRTKTYQTIAALVPRSQHRLILTGTPVQNHVHELWSLFDFLMPGYLGSERQFQSRYGKPIALANAATTRIYSGGGVTSGGTAVTGTVSSGRDLEAGTVALHELHQRVLPFILRRLKTNVLKDLPPKLVQDYLCELSDLQRILYDDFQHSQLAGKMGMDVDAADVQQKSEKPVDAKQPPNYGIALKALHYLRQVCNHPKFVLQPSHPRFDSIRQQFLSDRGVASSNSDAAVFVDLLDNIEFSGKLLALKDLLLSCGIGACAAENGDDELDSTRQQHRALIFFQSRSMLELAERIVFQQELPNVKYVTLTGAMPALARAGVVERFNAADSIVDVMLLTTSAGGLGLNLTGADTVIFVEHDWNPHRDLQAMDRAHRIGQKRIVSVYRLITKNTLEEKIMGLQKFKLFMADTIVNGDNVDPLNSLQAEEFMNLFALSAAETVDSGTSSNRKRPATASSSSSSNTKHNSRSLSALLESYNPDNDYEEFQSGVFLKKLKPC